MAETTLAGCKVEYEDPGTPGTFKEVKAASFPEIGQTGEFLDATTVDDIARRYIAGMQDQSDIEIQLRFDFSDANHVELRDLAINRQPTTMKFTFNDGTTTPSEATWPLALNGYRTDQTDPGAIVNSTISAKGAGAVVWVEAT